MLIKVDTTPAAFFYKPFCLTVKTRKYQINQKPWQKQFLHRFRKNKMTAMIINENFQVKKDFTLQNVQTQEKDEHPLVQSFCIDHLTSPYATPNTP